MNTLTTDCSIDAIKTEETDKTDWASNEEFLRVVFGNNSSDARPLLVSFDGNPASAPSKVWFGRPWMNNATEKLIFPENTNNYFSLAVFLPDDAGQYRRQKMRFHALHAIMLDDVGTKVAMEKLTVAPSWLLETSPGNHQAGYLLNDPLTDGNMADRLMHAIVAAGLCDPGANGPRTRLGRLPIAFNGKHEPPFRCRMLEWKPMLRYSVHELVDGLQLEMKQASRPKRQNSLDSHSQSSDDDPVWIPRPEENSVIAALRNHGWHKVPLGGGKHDITCPWVGEHTDGADRGTAYFEPDDNWPIGGFKCLHGHCANRHIRDLLEILNVTTDAARMKPTIRIIAGEIHRVVDAAERELAQLMRHYQRGGLIVTVVTDPGTRETRILEVTLPALVRALAGTASWLRFDGRSKSWARVDPPARHATVLLDESNYKHLPVLNGLARQPYLRPDGSLMSVAGYDAATGMFGVFDAREFTIVSQPSKDDAQNALRLLKELLLEFNFKTPSDLGATLAAILTAAIRPTLAHAPMFHVRAHMVGSGKSYLCEVITAFARPQRGTPTSFPADDEECRKLLLAELLRAPAVIEFDNLTTDLVAHKSLCTALTSEFLSGRILGVSKTATVNTRTLFLSSGNNVGPVQDMTRRCITINLDPGMEIPAQRSFKRPDLVRDLLLERGRYVSAALTIVRAWICAGKPKALCKPLASYGEWSDLCRQPLLWLGCADPINSIFEAIAEDPDREVLEQLLTVWRTIFGKSGTMVRDAIRKADRGMGDPTGLRDVLLDIAGERGEINSRKLGWWIRRHSGRIVNGLRFARLNQNSSAEKWRVESVSEVLPVFSKPIEETVNDDCDAYYRVSCGE